MLYAVPLFAQVKVFRWTQTSDPVPSTQAPATSPAASPAKTDTPGDQPPAQVQDQNSPGQQNTDQQNTKPQNTKPEDTKTTEDQKKVKDDRMFYVMPNYLTVQNESEAKPLTWKEKFVITAKGTFDPYEFVIVGVVSGIRQAENSYPAFGQGAEGYGKRYGAAFADQVDGNLMVGGVFPTILKTDPRYFRLGTGRSGAPVYLCHKPRYRRPKRFWRQYVQHSRVCRQRDGDCHFQRLLSFCLRSRCCVRVSPAGACRWASTLSEMS
jgi:hypothetical protein